jgi:hypothetical protein
VHVKYIWDNLHYMIWYTGTCGSNGYVPSKVFHCKFLVLMRKVEISESCSVRDGAEGRAMGSVTS